ncbi:aryl-sulfate sulfotransferase [bacterium]|nr:aryl-sulfate sulfotransferase [bacterium]
MAAACILQAAAVPSAIQYIHPLPGSRLHTPETTVILRLRPDLQDGVTDPAGLIRAKGKNRDSPGTVTRASDGSTLIFKPAQPFDYNDEVEVTIRTGWPDVDFHYTFYTVPAQKTLAKTGMASKISGPDPRPKAVLTRDVHTINGVPVPADFPGITTIQMGDTAPGLIFFTTNFPVNCGNYMIVCDNGGTPVFYRKITEAARSTNFLLHAGGLLSVHLCDPLDTGQWRHLIFDNTFTPVDEIRAGHGYITDNHELQLLPDGHALVIADQTVELDLSRTVPEGNTRALVQGFHFQELDRNKDVIFEWRSWDHYRVTDAVWEDLSEGSVDYVHMNSVDIDFDGHYIVSSRNLSEVTKIDRNTGVIIWRFGGVNNQFDFRDDDGPFSYQHDVRPVSGKPNHYLMFDNGVHHEAHYSRAVEYRLDMVAKTAGIAWQFRYTPDRAVTGMGSCQRLPQGNTLIDWPQDETRICEVTPEGKIVFELFSPGHTNYRCRRYDWHGRMKTPCLQIENHGDFVRLFFSQSGDPNVRYYNIYSGVSDPPETRIASTSQRYFDVNDPVNGAVNYYRVTSVDKDDRESGFSITEKTTVNTLGPGENAVRNGSFDSFSYWILKVTKPASAESGITGRGECRIHSDRDGMEAENIQLCQENVPIIEGRTYRFEFDAWASDPCFIGARVGENAYPYADYGSMGEFYITRKKKRYQDAFVMGARSDPDARVSFKCGLVTGDLYIDNVSLFYLETVSAAPHDSPADVPENLVLYPNVPNPFNPVTSISYRILKRNPVHLSVTNIAGQTVAVLVNTIQAPGVYSVKFTGGRLPAGVYVCRLKSGEASLTRRMVLIK